MNKKSILSNANLLFEELEPRLLLSADGLAVITESSVATTHELVLGNNEINALIVQNYTEQSSVVIQAKNHSSELVIIDSRAPNFQQLHNDIIHAQQQGRNIQVVVLDAHRDGIEQISEALTTYNNLDTVHIVSHGESGKLQLGATQLDKQTLKHRSEEIKQWQAAFVDAGDLLLYGCNLAGTTDGQLLVDELAKQTSTDVAASDDLTGNSLLGGDWELEYQTGNIESSLAFSADVQENWRGTLAAPVDLQTTTTIDGGASLNADGGNDVYFVADNGGSLFGGLSTVTVETSFSINTPGADLSPLLSYADGANDEELALFLKSDGRIWFGASSNGSLIASTTGNYMQLFDGERHQVSVSWDASNGAVEFYVDGQPAESITGYQTGQTLTGTGELVFGQDQDSVLGGFKTIDVFSGSLYDVRIFNDVRTAGEVAAGYDQTLPNTESGMIANWTFSDMSGGVITETVSGNNLTEQHVIGAGFSTSTPELTFSIPENSANGTAIGTVVGIDPDTGDTLTYSLIDDAGGRFAINSLTGQITLANTSLIDFETTASHNITIRVTDSGALTYDEVFTVDVINVNDAPVLDNTGIMSLSNIKENEIDSSGDLVSDIIASASGDRITDADAGAVEGIAVTAVDNTNGTWEYSTDGGTNWTAFGSVANTSAVVLTATGSDRIRFVPSASFSGVVNLSFHAWDTTDGLVSGTTSVDVSSNGGSTAFSSASEDVRVEVLPVEIRILFTTDKDINNSGVPGISSWTTGDVLAIGDPNLSFEPLGSDGSVYSYFNLETFASDGDMQMQGLHFVSRDVTVGSANSVDLQRGDILFISSNGETMTSTNSLTFAGGDVIAFRPDTPDDYSSGTFIHVLDQPGIQQTTGITLVEADTWVGDITLLGGSFLFTQADSGSGEANNIYHYSADDAGAGTTTGTVSTFITGTDINVEFNEFIGVMLVTQDTPLNGTTVTAGTIITTLANGDSFTGDNSIATNEDEVLTLDVSTTTMGLGASAADVTVLFDGGDIGLNNNNKKMRSLAFIEIVGPVNVEPVITLPGSGINYTENDPPAVIDAIATLVDPDSADFDGGILRVEIASNGTANDRLSVQNEGTAAGQVGVSGNNVTYGGTVIGNFLGGTSASDPLFVYFDANADVTAVQAVMRNITYENTSTSPSTAQRTVNFVISDGDLGTSAVVSTTIDVIDVVTSNAPVATNDPGGYSAIVSSYNPPSYWSFGETSGTTASDNGNTGNDGTFNGVTLGQTGAINGDTGTAIGFDGSNDYVVMPHDDAYLIDDGTVQLWFNANDLLTDQALISKDSTGFDTGGHFTISALTDGSIQVRLQSTTDSNFLSSAPASISAGSWHHVAVSFGSSGMELFLDGVSVDTNPYTGGMGTTSGGIGNYEPLVIGASTMVSGNGVVTPLEDYFGGSIDEVAIIDQALTAEQIQDIYASALQNYTILEDTSLVVSAAEGVLINDSDADGDPLTAVLVAGPSNATSFTLNADGSFSYTPLANFSGTDTFTYMANDGSANSNVATVMITVNGDNDAPVNTVPGTQIVLEDTQTAIAGISVADPDAAAAIITTQLTVTNGVLDVALSGAATISAGANSSGTLTISGNVTDINATLGSLQYTGNSNVNGVAADTLTVVTNDLGNAGTGGAQSDTDNIQIDITAVNDAPVARDDRVGLVFDGVDDYVRIGDYPGLIVSTNLTMEAWIKPTGLGTGSKIIINKEGEFELGITADTGEIKWALDNIDPDWNWHNTGYFVQAGEWAHLAVTYNNGVVNTYADGVLVESYNGSGVIGDTYPLMNELQIGGRENAVTQRFDGSIDEVRIWNTTRTQVDITSSMNSLLSGAETGLIGNWRFDEGSGTAVVDQSALGHNGTLADGVTVAEMPGWLGYVVSEDGTLNVSAVNGVLTNDFDLDGDTLTAVLVAGPVNAAAFTLNPDGSFTYTPTANFNGIDSFTYMANDGGANSNIATVTIRVDAVNDAPTATNLSASENYTEDTTLNLTDIVVSDVDSANVTATLTLSDVAAGSLSTTTSGLVTSTFVGGVWTASGALADVNTLLAGVTFNPVLNYNSNFSIATSVDDGVAAAITGSKVITATPANDAPTATNLSAAESYTEDTALNLTDIVVSDVDSANVTVTLTLSDVAAGTLSTATSNLVTSTFAGGVWTASGALVDVNTLLAGVTFNPVLNYNSNFSIATSVDDGVAAAITGSKVITATPVIDPAIIAGVDTGIVTEDLDPDLDTLLETSGLLTITDADTGEANFIAGTITGLYGDLSIDAAGNWNYSADNTQTVIQNLAAGATLTDTISVSSFDGTTHNIVITIGGVNDAPTALNDTPTTVDEGGTAIFDLAANDFDIDNALDLSSIVTTVAPANGILTFNGDGTVTYVHDGSETVSDSFSYTIADITGAISNTATVNVTVNPLNDAPSALDDVQTVAEGNSINIDLAANDVDVDNAIALNSIVIVGAPVNGTLSVNTNGTVDYTHDGSQTLSDSFSYIISDISGAISNTATVNITVIAVNNSPTTIGITDVTVTEDAAATSIDLNAAFDDVDNPDSELTYAITGNTSIGLFTTTAVNPVTGELVLDYAADMNGTSQISIRATDPTGAFVDTLFTVTVTAVNDTPLLVANAGITAVGTSSTVISNGELSVNDIDNPDTVIVYTVTVLPTSGVLMLDGVPLTINGSFTEDDVVNNRLSYQADATGTNDQFAFTVSDGAGGTITANSFDIVVQIAPPPPEPEPETIDPVVPPETTITPVDDGSEPVLKVTEIETEAIQDLAGVYVGGSDRSIPQPGLTLEPVQHIGLDQPVNNDFDGGVKTLEQINLYDEINLSTASTVADIQLKSIKALWIAIDDMKQQINEDLTEDVTQVQIRLGAISGSGVALTAGVVAWVLRGGALMTSLISTIPLWKGYDPLPILAYRDDDDDDEKENNITEDKIPTSLEELKKVKALREKIEKYNQVDSMFDNNRAAE